MKVGVVDIGTNSMRLLVTDGNTEYVRRVEVTGLGRGVDQTGWLGDREMDATIEVLDRYGKMMTELGVERTAAVATSATRDASNSDEFVARVSAALGIEPDIIDGEHEGRLAFVGATADLSSSETWLVSDIGGGSTEFVTVDSADSIDIGSVRLTDRILVDRPADQDQMSRAADHVGNLFASVAVAPSCRLVGVAGTWTSLAGLDLGLEMYSRELVHHHVLTTACLSDIVDTLAGLTVEQTIAAYPGLDPKRAPVILAGAVVAVAVLAHTGSGSALISERDSLDGLAMDVLALA